MFVDTCVTSCPRYINIDASRPLSCVARYINHSEECNVHTGWARDLQCLGARSVQLLRVVPVHNHPHNT